MDLLTTKHTRNTKKVSKNKSSHSALEHPQVKIQQQAIFDSAPKQYSQTVSRFFYYWGPIADKH